MNTSFICQYRLPSLLYFLLCPLFINAMEEGEIQFLSPHRPSDAVSKILEPTLKNLGDLQCKGPFTYQRNTDDFGLIKTRLAIIRPDRLSPIRSGDDKAVESIPNDLIILGEQLGFKTAMTHSQYFPRDLWFNRGGVLSLGGNGEINNLLFTQSKETIKNAINRAKSKALFFKEKAAVLSLHPSLGGNLGASTKYFAHAALDAENFTGKKAAPVLPFFIEGGNHLIVTNLKGEKILLLGNDLAAVVLNQLLLNHYFENEKNKNRIEKQADEIKGALTKEKIEEIAEEMFRQGILKLNNKDGMITSKKLNGAMEKWSSYKLNAPLKPLIEVAQEYNFIEPFPIESLDIEEVRPIAAKYIAQKQFVEDLIITKMGVNKLIWIEQMAYHLDEFMKSGPKGSVLLHDFSLTTELITTLATTNPLGLTEKDLDAAYRYKALSSFVDRDIKQLSKNIENKLEAASLQVIKVPGWFLRDGLSHPIEANFMNGISGFSPKTNRHYYITTGASVGDKMGQVLMDAFALFLKKYVPDIDVFYIGRSRNSNDFSEPMKWWNSDDGKAGVHCMTFELETESHEHF